MNHVEQQTPWLTLSGVPTIQWLTLGSASVEAPASLGRNAMVGQKLLLCHFYRSTRVMNRPTDRLTSL